MQWSLHVGAKKNKKNNLILTSTAYESKSEKNCIQNTGCEASYEYHRRRMETEAKAKVVTSVWGADFVQFLAALAVLPRSIWKKRLNSAGLVFGRNG